MVSTFDLEVVEQQDISLYFNIIYNTYTHFIILIYNNYIVMMYYAKIYF
jgi:hypothetical protein